MGIWGGGSPRYYIIWGLGPRGPLAVGGGRAPGGPYGWAVIFWKMDNRANHQNRRAGFSRKITKPSSGTRLISSASKS